MVLWPLSDGRSFDKVVVWVVANEGTGVSNENENCRFELSNDIIKSISVRLSMKSLVVEEPSNSEEDDEEIGNALNLELVYDIRLDTSMATEQEEVKSSENNEITCDELKKEFVK